MAATWSDMPRDIVISILSRLPVKSLMRFRCVCKSWYSLVADPNFIDLHIRANNDGYVFAKHRSIHSSEHMASLLYDETCVEHTRLELPFRSFPIPPWVVGYSNGLFCIACPSSRIRHGENKFDIYLWNPSIRKFMALPETLPLIDSFQHIDIAFGFVPQTNDYMLVKFHYDENFPGRFNRGGLCIAYPPRVDVFSLRTNSWKEIQNVVLCETFDSTRYSVLNGIAHWVAAEGMDGNEYEFILSFDMANELFSKIELPEYGCDDDCELICKSTMALMESLYLLVHFEDEINVFLDIWVMNEYGAADSWTKQFAFKCGVDRLLVPVGLMKDGEIVLKGDGELVSCDPRAQQVKDIHIHLIHGWLTDFTYSRESLLLLNEGN